MRLKFLVALFFLAIATLNVYASHCSLLLSNPGCGIASYFSGTCNADKLGWTGHGGVSNNLNTRLCSNAREITWDCRFWETCQVREHTDYSTPYCTRKICTANDDCVGARGNRYCSSATLWTATTRCDNGRCIASSVASDCPEGQICLDEGLGSANCAEELSTALAAPRPDLTATALTPPQTPVGTTAVGVGLAVLLIIAGWFATKSK